MMKKRILPLILLVLFTFSMAISVYGAPLDPNGPASLTLRYQKDGKTFPNLKIGVFRVAEAFPDGTFAPVEPFSSWPVNIHGITSQAQWNLVAETLCAYIMAYQVQPDREATTDEQGTACFTDLKTGLYFVHEVVAENDSGTYLFNQFLVYVPTPQPDGTFLYDVEAIPKCNNFVPKTEYTVNKLWQDGGNQENRPKEVTVDIYRDGTLQESVILSAENGWSYTWKVSGGDTGKWTVAERTVQPPYKVKIQQNGSTFSIINTWQNEPDPPKTGDTFAPMPWILAMCLSGMMLLVLSLYGRRCK